MLREARVVALRPEYRRFARAVLARVRAPRALAQQLGMELRRRLEDAEAAGASPAEAIAAQGDPDQIAAAWSAEHGLKPRVRDSRRLARAAGAGAAVLLTAAGLVGWSRIRGNAAPTAQAMGEILPHGIPAAARTLVWADLRGDGRPMLVGWNQGNGPLLVVAWDVAEDGTLRIASQVHVGVPWVSPAAVGHFLPGPAEQVALAAGSDVALVGWRNGGLAVLSTTSLPQALTIAPETAASSGLDSLYAVSTSRLPPYVLTRLAWRGSALSVAGTAAVTPAAGVLPFPEVSAGQVAGHPYVALTRGNNFGTVCTGPVQEAEVFDGITLAPVWQGHVGRHGVQLLPAPDGALEVAADLAAPGAPGAILRWNGSGWGQVGAFPCQGRILGLDAAGQALVALGPRLERADAGGQVVSSALWPFTDPMQMVPGLDAVAAWGPYVALGTPWHLDVARETGAAWQPVWEGSDSTSVQGLSLAPSGQDWDLVDPAGNVYAPAGGSWAWAGVPAPTPKVRAWSRFCGTAVVAQIERTAGRGQVQLLGPGGGTLASWTQPAGAVLPSQAFVLPLGAHRCDVGLLYQRTGQTSATLQVLRLQRGGAMGPVGALTLPPPPLAARYQVSAVIPGPGRVQIVLAAATMAGQNPVTTHVSATWDGRTLAATAPPGTPGQDASFSAPFQTQGRWLVAGLAHYGPGPSLFAQGGPAAYSFQTIGDPVRMVLGRLQASGRVSWSTFPLPTTDPGQVTVLPVPDGSGRILVTASGRTFVYRAR